MYMTKVRLGVIISDRLFPLKNFLLSIILSGNAISQPVFRYGFWGTVFCVINFTCFISNAWTTSLYDLFRKD